MFVFPKMNISNKYEHQPRLPTLPGRQCVSLSIVVAMFLCCTRHCCSSSVELMSWNIRVNAKTFFNFNRITTATLLGLHLCRHPEDVCCCQLPGSERGKKRWHNTNVPRTNSLISTTLITFSFCASPRTLSNSVMESTNPWKWWLHIFSISLSWFLIRASSFSMKRPCSCPSYTELKK